MLKTCSECKYSIVEDNIENCPNCGTSLEPLRAGQARGPSPFSPGHGQDDDEPISSHCTLDDDDDLGLQSTADLMEQTARGLQPPPQARPSYREEEDTTEDGDLSGEVVPDPYEDRPNQVESDDSREVTPNGVHRLSDDEVKQLNSDLYDNADHLSEKEKLELLSKVQGLHGEPERHTVRPRSASPHHAPEEAQAAEPVDTPVAVAAAADEETPSATTTAPAPVASPRAQSDHREEPAEKPEQPSPTEKPETTVPPQAVPTDRPAKSDEHLPRPQMAARGRGIAYYWKNYIELRTSMEIKEGQDLVINDREFELRQKRINPKVLMIGGGALFVILCVWLTTLLVSDPIDGRGRIIGVVLDHFGQPYLKQATLAVPDLKIRATSNAQGMFVIDEIPEGSHRLEIYDDGLPPTVDYATVSQDGITLVTIRLQPPTTASAPQASVEPEQQRKAESKPSAPPRTEQVAESRRQERASRNKKPGKIALEASVGGAALVVDGKTLGMGNLVYSQVANGEHRYEVAKDGYHPVKGTVRVTSGKTTRLEVELTPMTLAEKKKTYDAGAFYQSALDAYNRNDMKTALADLNSALEKDPGMVAAYVERGDILSEQGHRDQAHDDYLRAAEIYRIRREFTTSMITYNKALELDPSSQAALLGRAELFLAQGEEIAALTDFDAARRLDRGNAAAHLGMGKARFQQGRYREAIEHFRDARNLEKENPLVYQYMMLAYLGDRNENAVRKVYEQFQAVASDQQVADFWANSKYAGLHRVLN